MDKVFSNPDVYCVRVPFVNLASGESNCYIVRDGGDCLVVDPGAANEVGMRRVRNALFELGVAPGECKVFLTHTHFDHAEAARVLFPEGTCVYVSEVGFEERSPIRAEAARELFVRRMLKMGATLADAEEYSRNDYEPTFLPAGAFDYRFVREGDEVHVGRFVFDVVEVPGHTLDLVCLVGRDGAPSFTGDEVIFGTTPSVDAPFGGEDALALYMEGLGLSDDSQPHGVDGEWLQHVHWTLPGHGEGFGGQTLRSRATDIVARKLRHCDRMIATVRECPGIGGEELARRSLTQKDEAAWRAAPSISRYYSMLEAFVGARYLENQGKLRREEVDGTWRFYVC